MLMALYMYDLHHHSVICWPLQILKNQLLWARMNCNMSIHDQLQSHKWILEWNKWPWGGQWNKTHANTFRFHCDMARLQNEIWSVQQPHIHQISTKCYIKYTIRKVWKKAIRIHLEYNISCSFTKHVVINIELAVNNMSKRQHIDTLMLPQHIETQKCN